MNKKWYPDSLVQRFSTCGPRPTGGPRTSA